MLLRLIMSRLAARGRFAARTRPRRTISYRHVKPSLPQQKQEKTIPLFGADSRGFGMDWAGIQSQSPRVPTVGYHPEVPRPVWNRGGSTANLKPLITDKGELQSTRRTLSYKPTDQAAPKRGSSSTWDGKVRNFQTRKGYLSTSRTGRTKTFRDQLTEEMRKEPYSFF